MARPNKYDTHVAPRLTEVEDWVRNGATNKEVAQRLGISIDSFCEYQKIFPEFSEVLKKRVMPLTGKSRTLYCNRL